MQKIVVKDVDYGDRLDVYLTKLLTDVTRARVQKMLKEHKITVNDENPKSGYMLRYGDVISIDNEVTDVPTIPEIDIPILYEDSDCLVINKPVGVLSHSKGAFNPEATVGTFIQQHTDKMPGERSGIVHRLDRATSGVMICAKTPEAASWLQKQFSSRKVKKSYIAVITGTLDPDHAVIDMPIERNPKQPQTFRVGANGKPSVTEYKVVETSPSMSIVELTPLTGRTHQLRVHLEHFDHPIVGDTLYGGAPADRLYLHAHTLEITLPNRERTTFEAKLPEAFNTIMS